ncbi:putative protein kinase RLK-Pelle-L-LEC family [Helianthus annuus]|nr:putative protein kinase RLK-Pelle-L-LEC family [Helianthus annuus]
MAFSCFYFLMLLLPISKSVYFQVSRFDSTTNDVVYIGDAAPSFGSVNFNSIVYCCRVGQVLYKQRVPLWDSNSGQLSDFITHFSFAIDIEDFMPYGHGIAFFLAPVGFTSPLNSAAGFLGLFNSITSDDSSQGPIVSVEFDSFSNQEWDPPFEHVGINRNSLSSVSYASWNASLYNKQTANCWVSYNSTTNNLSVFWTYERNPNYQGNSNLSYRINLKEVLPSCVTIGITASTGQFMEKHTLQYWDFNSSLDITEESKTISQKLKLTVGITVPLGVISTVCILAYTIRSTFRKRHREEAAETINLTSINEDLEQGAGPKRFSYRDLALATNNFTDDLKLGEGGFGCVYRGFLTRERRLVAVKKISKGSKQGKKEYITEVKIISSLRHRNLVQLIGWCHDENQFLLVYEFTPNGSLDSHLFGNMPPLAWGLRYKISLGLASALLYLHEEWEQRVIHRDIKSSNVMLDSAFNAKLGDFGLVMDHELGLQTTGLAGTLGYMAPEYVRTGKASKESDVYSFGVVAIEICCGRKARDCIDDDSEMALVDWVRFLYKKGEILLAVDEKLNQDYDEEQAKRLMMVGLWCAQADRRSRPSIRQAIQVLNFEADVRDLSIYE